MNHFLTPVPVPFCAVYSEAVNFADNTFTGELPEDIGLLEKLVIFAVQNNGLTGFIPESIGDLPMLQLLSLSNNDFVGPVPEAITNATDLREYQWKEQTRGVLVCTCLFCWCQLSDRISTATLHTTFPCQLSLSLSLSLSLTHTCTHSLPFQFDSIQSNSFPTAYRCLASKWQRPDRNHPTITGQSSLAGKHWSAAQQPQRDTPIRAR